MPTLNRQSQEGLMSGVQNLPLFIASGLLLNITPGPDTFYILARSIAQGRRAGVLSALGICCGCIVHTLAAALGLSVVLATSAAAFIALKLVGAAYLIYLGFCMWREPPPAPNADPADKRATDWELFARAFLPTCSIPKWRCFSWRSCHSSSTPPRRPNSRRSCSWEECSSPTERPGASFSRWRPRRSAVACERAHRRLMQSSDSPGRCSSH